MNVNVVDVGGWLTCLYIFPTVHTSVPPFPPTHPPHTPHHPPQKKQLTPQETDHALAAAVLMHLLKLDAAATIEGQLASADGAGGPAVEDTLFVHLLGGGKGKAGATVYELAVDESSTGCVGVCGCVGVGVERGERGRAGSDHLSIHTDMAPRRPHTPHTCPALHACIINK